jgi:hypothetical protein
MSHLKQLLTDNSDPEEVRLYRELLKSHHEFLKYKMEKIRSIFPGGVRHDDTWRYAYPDVKESIDTPKPNGGKERRKLALRFHPDKCEEPDAQALFSFAWEADDDVVARVLEAEDPLTMLRSEISATQPAPQEEEIDTWMKGYPYNWFYHRDQFIPEEEYNRKRAEAERLCRLRVEQEELRQANAELRRMQDELRRDKEERSKAMFENLDK